MKKNIKLIVIMAIVSLSLLLSACGSGITGLDKITDPNFQATTCQQAGGTYNWNTHICQ